jgi:hypothetical protein
MSHLIPHTRRIAVAAVVVFLAVAGIAYAAIPDDGTGTYHACMLKGVGTIRVIDPARQRCSSTLESEITFNEKGARGEAGVSPRVAQLAAGDAHCATGGAAITDAAGTTAYVCSGRDGAAGTPFSGTFTSPNQEYSISVTDSGVVLASAAGASVRLVGNDIDVRADDDLSATVGDDVAVHLGGSLDLRASSAGRLETGTALTLRAGSDLSARASAGATLQAAAGVDVLGSTLRLNPGTTCLPAARLGDPVSPSQIVGGSPTVCLG